MCGRYLCSIACGGYMEIFFLFSGHTYSRRIINVQQYKYDRNVSTPSKNNRWPACHYINSKSCSCGGSLFLRTAYTHLLFTLPYITHTCSRFWWNIYLLSRCDIGLMGVVFAVEYTTWKKGHDYCKYAHIDIRRRHQEHLLNKMCVVVSFLTRTCVLYNWICARDFQY